MPVLILTLALALCAAVPAQAQTADALAAAQTLFEQAQAQKDPPARKAAFRRAAAAFEKIHTDQGVVSARLFTDIGNAYAFAGDRGDAALWFSRALVLDPHQPRARAGLNTIEKQLPWTPVQSSTAGLLRTLFFWHDGLSFAARRTLFLIVWPLAWLLLALRKKVRLLPGLLALLAGLALLGSLLVSAGYETRADRAVVRVTTQGRTGDGEVYSPSHSAPIPAGSEARVLEARRGWVHIALPDETRAWVREAAIARLVPRG